MKERPREFNTLLSDSKYHVSELLSVFIIKVVRMYYGLEENYEKSRSRSTDFVKGRQMAMYLIRTSTKLSLSSIGQMFGKDHATVLHSIKTIKNYLFYDKQVKIDVREISQIIEFKSLAINEDVDWKKDYYYVDMNSFTSLKFDKTDQSIIMTGFSDDEIEDFSKMFKHLKNTRKHNNTGMYILERILKNNTKNGK
tara:strand:- start:12432 stop:13019 length:588 start_codon:yes stop_codon:yes gene_type:complete